MEYTIINYLGLLADDVSLRIDAEHYKREYFHVKKSLLKIKSQKLLNFIDRPVMTGHTPSMKNDRFYNGDVNFIKTDNLREHYIDGDFTHKLSEEGNKTIKRSSLKENDVLVTIIGATSHIVGRACLVKKKDLPANINQNIALIRVSRKLSPEYLTVYLNSYYGRNYLWYLSRQTEQVNLNCREIEKLLVPVLSEGLTGFVGELHKKAYFLHEKSEELIKQAEQILLSELGLLNWKPKHSISFVKNFSDTQTSGRIDAEYFQPKYDFILKKIKSADNLLLKDNFNILKGKNFPYIFGEAVGVIKTKQLAKTYMDFNVEDFTSFKMIEQSRLPLIQNNDVVFASMGVGSLGKTNIFYDFESDKKFTIDSTLRIFRKKSNTIITPEFLTVYLNSLVGQTLIYQNVVGTSGIISIYENYLKNLPVPILKEKMQLKISNSVVDAHKNQILAIKLLKIAKRGVEMAIEKSEKDAQSWINSELKKLNIH